MEVNVIFTYFNCEVLLCCSAVDKRRMTFEIVDALAYLNRQGLVHRNLSPTNILVSPEVNTVLVQIFEGRKFRCFRG